jgi:hypothetical protein
MLNPLLRFRHGVDVWVWAGVCAVSVLAPVGGRTAPLCGPLAALTPPPPPSPLPFTGLSGRSTTAGAPIVDREVAAESDEVDEDVDRGFEQFTIESGGGGDEFMAVKPWLGAVVAPTNPPVIPRGMPKVKLHLDWVYGYRGFDARNNVR